MMVMLFLCQSTLCIDGPAILFITDKQVVQGHTEFVQQRVRAWARVALTQRDARVRWGVSAPRPTATKRTVTHSFQMQLPSSGRAYRKIPTIFKT